MLTEHSIIQETSVCKLIFARAPFFCYTWEKGKERERVYRILIVEDDLVIADEIAAGLSKWGFDVLTAPDLVDVEATFLSYAPHLVLMDVSLPFYNGYYWCERLRRHGSTPIVFLSSMTSNMDVVMAINMGGDDYILKPVSMDVLTAKVQAWLRRVYNYEPAASARIGIYTFDAANCCLVHEQTRIPLTRNEARLLDQLQRKRGGTVTREQLMLALWDSCAFVDDNTLTVNINRLRRTLREAGLPDAVRTHKGEGYSLDA